MGFGFHTMTEEQRQAALAKAAETRAKQRTRFEINHDLYITVDPYNYILQKKNNDGSFSDISYHSDLEQALTAYLAYGVRKALLEKDDGQFADLLATVKAEKAKQSDEVRTLLNAVHIEVQHQTAEPAE